MMDMSSDLPTAARSAWHTRRSEAMRPTGLVMAPWSVPSNASGTSRRPLLTIDKARAHPGGFLSFGSKLKVLGGRRRSRCSHHAIHGAGRSAGAATVRGRSDLPIPSFASRTPLVDCPGGSGRTGHVLAGWLLHDREMEAEDAIATVRGQGFDATEAVR